LRLNEPRYVKLPNLMMARKKPIETIALDSLNLALTNSVQQLKVATPPERPAGIMVKDVNELLSKLRTHEGIIA